MVDSSLPKLNFALKASDIATLTKSILEEGVRELDRVASTPPTNCTFSNVIWPLAALETNIEIKLSAATFLQNVSTDGDVRQASVEATKQLEKYEIDKTTREDLFRVVKCVAENAEEMGRLDDESRRLVNKMMTVFKHNGLLLEPELRQQLKAKRTRLAELMVDFSNNMNEDRTELLLTTAELEGCPSDFLEGREIREDGKYVVTMKYPDVFGVLKYAKSETVRRSMDEAFNSRCRQSNRPILEEALRLRFECAKLLGYKNHAEFQLEERLAKSSAAVMDFEEDLKAKLTPFGEKELALMREMKVKETGNADAVIYSFDYHYYARKILERDYAIDNEKLKEYFSLESVIREMLHIYEEVLGLKFKLLSEPSHVWHSDVLMYEVTNAGDGRLMGHLYFDLFPRDGKYTHAACFSLQLGCYLDEHREKRQLPASAMVCNFTQPSPSKPSLLTHDEVVTLFHELGHAMHGMCAVTIYSRFQPSNVETDFVEAPSQMLENWCWNGSILKRLARHYQRPTETLPDELIQQLVRAKTFNAGLLNLRQIFFGLFDMTIHSIEQPDLSQALGGASIDAFYESLRRNVTLIPQPPNISPASSFGHMMGGYDAGYYGYLWSEVFSADMFYSRFAREGLQNAAVGAEYRKKILEPGASRDSMEGLVDFLGRRPTNDAFLRSLGLIVEVS